ncbi:MAG: hypothetical protein J6B48_00170 [Clostridia bacterium]|nr:hypothetical protein [Clostridia bacterium]
MKNRFSKILVLVLSLALILGVALAVSVSAEDTKPEIISKNMNYGEKFVILYAVDAETVAEGPVTLKIYSDSEKANLVDSYTVDTPVYEEKLQKDIYKFYTNGIAPKEIADIFYAEAIDAAGNTSDLVSYSVVEYMLERLYGGYELSPEQTAMYTKSLEFGAAAQDLLAAQDPIRVNDYKYVRIDGGTANGVTKGMFLKNTSLSIAKNEIPSNALFWGWNVTAGGETERKSVVDTLVLEDNTVLVANIIADGSRGYFNTFGGYTYDGITESLPVSKLFVTNDLVDRIGVDSVDVTFESHPSTNHLSLVSASETDTVFEIGRGNTSYHEGAAFKTASSSGNYVVFETDIYMSNLSTLNFDIGFAYTSDAATNAEMLDYGKYNVAYKDGGFDVFGVTVAPEKWVNISVELSKNDGIIKYYVNGVNTLSVDAGTAPDISHFYIDIPAGNNTRNSWVRLNNTFCDYIEAHLAESDEYLTYNDGVVPSGMQTTGGGVASITDAPWNLTTEKVLNLVTGGTEYSYCIPVSNYSLAGANGFVFEAKMRVDTELDVYAFAFQITKPNRTMLSKENFTFTKSTYNLQLDDWTSTAAGTNHKENVKVIQGSWMDLKAVAKVTDGSFSVTYYINGVEIATSCNSDYVATAIADVYFIQLKIGSPYTGNIQLDDVRFVKTAE